MLIHGYAYPVPDGKAFKFNLLNLFKHKEGPWLKSKFKKKKYCDLEQNTNAMQTLTNHFNDMLIRIANAKSLFPYIDVKHVDLRECLSNDVKNNKYKKDWSDEFHPSEQGFERIATEFHQIIENLQPIPVDAA